MIITPKEYKLCSFSGEYPPPSVVGRVLKRISGFYTPSNDMRRVHVRCFHPSVRQSVLLFCHRNSSGTARRNFLILCHYEGHSFFILGVMPLSNLEENSLSSQLSRISCNFLVKVNIPFRCAYSLEILI